MITITNKKAKQLVGAWLSHVINKIDITTCAYPFVKCPIHKFFSDMDKQLKMGKMDKIKHAKKNR